MLRKLNPLTASFATGKKAFKQRAVLDETIHIKHGRDTKVALFEKFDFVYTAARETRR